ncbi:MAG: SPOR domain-containing protein [Bacteroidales bacterium]|nr:SPOR domain-containing protein [Bacteroidales bacterium]
MKKTLIFALVLSLLVTGCDYVRKIAGRPTAAEIEAIRLEKMAAEEARHQAILDSLENAEKAMAQAMAEALAAREAHLLDSLSQEHGTVLNPAKLGGLYTTKLESKYYIVVGAFRNRSYAERKLKACNAAGYTATIVSFRNGLLAVALCPSDNLDETLKTLKSMRGTGVCPKDGWILMNF